MKIVLANGCFDILHQGHVQHLKQAKSMGDFLVVSLTADEYVNKGPKKPVNTWEARAEVLRELRSVDEVIKTSNAVSAILKIRPYIFVKGIDYSNKDNFTEDIEGVCLEAGTLLKFTDTPKQTARVNECQCEV